MKIPWYQNTAFHFIRDYAVLKIYILSCMCNIVFFMFASVSASHLTGDIR